MEETNMSNSVGTTREINTIHKLSLMSIQANDILLRSIEDIQEFITKNKLKSYLCGQAQDSCIFMCHPDEKDFLLTEMQEIYSKMNNGGNQDV